MTDRLQEKADSAIRITVSPEEEEVLISGVPVEHEEREVLNGGSDSKARESRAPYNDSLDRVRSLDTRQTKSSSSNIKPVHDAPANEKEIVLRYRAFAQLERWFEHRFRHGSTSKLLYLSVVALLFFALTVQWWDTLIEFLVQWSGGGSIAGGTTGGAATGGINLVTIVQLSILCSVFGAFLFYLSKPTHVALSSRGVRFLWRHALLSFASLHMRWPAMSRIRLEMPEGKTSPEDQKLVFETCSLQRLEIKLGSIAGIEDRERLLKAIEKWAIGIPRDAQVLQALEPPADHSYTELWLQALSAPPKRERFKPLATGATLHEGRFKILEQLGVGGQGTAYLARDSSDGTVVVLKEFILPVYVDIAVRRQALERFENEARLLKQLDHPQIVRLVEFFLEDHRSYLVLEHIDGNTLKQLVDSEGALSEERVGELALQMCEILVYLHKLSPPVVHRDFTPDNLILRKDGTLKLVDFNVAQQTESTATGTVVGKHAYLPPEQFRGTPCTQSDIYAMGATMHYLLTGKDPEPISISHPGSIRQGISDSMDHLVAKATDIKLESRYKNADQLASALKNLFGGHDLDQE